AAPKSSMTVMPAAIAEEADEKPLEQDQFIGTGPYKFKEWDRGEEIVLERFDDYAARDEEDWGGLTGKKEEYFDELHFQIVKECEVEEEIVVDCFDDSVTRDKDDCGGLTGNKDAYFD